MFVLYGETSESFLKYFREETTRATAKSTNILIAFRNTISLSTDILILSADTLIELDHINKQTIHYAPVSSFSPILFFCCHIVTLSHLPANILNMLVLRA